MLNFNLLESNKESLRLQYLTAKPFPHIQVLDICDDNKLKEVYNNLPSLENKSRDLVFAKNKFEKSNYGTLHPYLEELYNDLRSERFNTFLSFISGGKDVFVDPRNYGGGLHQGRGQSKLDMHLDFNYHPENKLWYREMNILLYMNDWWKNDHGGQLELRDLRTDDETEVEVPWNSMIIQQCSNYSLHGYSLTSFPEGRNRTSIATYAYINHVRHLEKPRTTDWFVDGEESLVKKWLGRKISTILKVKHFFLKSGTSKNY